MSTIGDFGLIADPFAITVGELSVHKWAGREREKELLLDVVESVRSSDIGSSEFVVVHGDYGAGKSHALRYLTTLINEDEVERFKGKAIYVQTVRVSQKITFVDVYRTLIDQLGRDFFSTLAAHVNVQVNSAATAYLQSLSHIEASSLMADRSLLVSRTLGQHVPPSLTPFIHLLLKAANGGLVDVWRYLRGEKLSFPDIGLNSSLDADYPAVATLAGLFKVMTSDIGNERAAYEAVYLFVDEQENLVEMKAVESIQLLQSFRELLNQLPNYFCMIWGFSADAALIEAVLPTPILQRLTRKYIELPALEPEAAKKFVREQLSGFRKPEFIAPSLYYPFSEAAVDAVLERIVEMTPRNIFKLMRAVLERAVRKHGLEPPNAISGDLANSILDLQT
ncbi:ATP-binding protein [Variovorax sp. AFSI2.2]|uniref:ATP-binding protein n=1 Tax=Variovorax sp. AFSI2.2 TaxID=3384160 RepID=UPI003EBAA340